ncbi:Histidine kinase-like ATPase domain-containing protein [Actinomadura meyerae]|uniref:Histidine kinase-like ATPase domain-containing protein n=1 Tax=Actinomadura meyerae TaxID=240840 RepID=A0A239EJE1_9ACTN|nr:Histidine kinase-like ATPase domain-containing protein [Actinomadura meyerae]
MNSPRKDRAKMITTPDCLLVPMLASNAAPGLARTLTRPRLDKWGYVHISDDAFLIASELITNAVAATPGKEIRYQCSRDTAGVLIAVWDASPTVPRVHPLIELTLDTLDVSEENWDDNGGRGLPIVTALATECGHTPDPSGGKWVWARLKP